MGLKVEKEGGKEGGRLEIRLLAPAVFNIELFALAMALDAKTDSIFPLSCAKETVVESCTTVMYSGVRSKTFSRVRALPLLLLRIPILAAWLEKK